MQSGTTIPALLSVSAARAPESEAVESPGRPALTFAQLIAQIGGVGAELRRRGVGPTDAVASILPNGPEAALVFLAVSSVARCAPLNPAYGGSELEFYLGDLDAKHLIISSEIDSPARDIARGRGAVVIELAAVADHAAVSLDGTLPGPAERP